MTAHEDECNRPLAPATACPLSTPPQLSPPTPCPQPISQSSSGPTSSSAWDRAHLDLVLLEEALEVFELPLHVCRELACARKRKSKASEGGRVRRERRG
eukprot:2352672-Rhodomonas_salina.1